MNDIRHEYEFVDVRDANFKKLFLDFPKTLYGSDLLQDYDTEKQILEKTHILSPDITVFPYVVIDNRERVICRCLMTYYPDDPVAYVGFFEAKNNLVAVKKMIDAVQKKAVRDGKTKLIGPVNASIYIDYRFKVDRFDKIYTGEPYNKEYYPQLWEKCGFTVSERYVSNQLRKVEEADIDARLEKVYNRYLEKGYRFVQPTKKDFNKHLLNVYHLMMETYSDFPCYKRLSECQFIEMFSSLKSGLNFDMVKLAYKDDRLCAFCVSVPNYGTITRGNMTFKKIFDMIKVRKKPSEYVILYVGADKKSAGVGSALIHDIRGVLHKNQCTSIGALIKEGNLTGELYKDLYTDQFHYALYSKNI